MKQAQIDYLNWRYALKSNMIKGVHTLRSILADPAQAKMFAESPAAVAVVLSYDTENPDKNAVELHNLLSKSSVAEIASNTYLCNTYGVANFGELFEDEELMATALEDSATMNAIVSSESAMESIATNSKAMESVAASETAMASVASSEVAMETIIYTPGALSILVSSETAMAAVMGNEVAIGVATGSSTAMASIAASQVAVNAMLASDAAVEAATSSKIAMSAVASSSTAMKSVIADGDALASVAESLTAMAEVAASSIAMAAVSASSSAMLAMAVSAVALNAICKVSAARTSWMKSSYAQTYYDSVYETLHNAPDSLFTKHEDYYNSAGWTSAFVDSYMYATDGVEPSSTASDAVPEGIVLTLHTNTCYSNYDGKVYSLQTGTLDETVPENSWSSPYEYKRVFVGGIKWIKAELAYAHYVAV